MKTITTIAAALLASASALAQQQPAQPAQAAPAAPQAPAPTERCKVVLATAQGAQEIRESEIREKERKAAQRAKEASSCLARAGDNIVRAAIPPSLGSIFAAVSDPAGYITNATSNAACNVVNQEAGKVARGYGDLNGALQREGGAVDQAFRGGVDQALGGNGASYGQYTGQQQQKGKDDDREFWKTMSCRLFGKC